MGAWISSNRLSNSCEITGDNNSINQGAFLSICYTHRGENGNCKETLLSTGSIGGTKIPDSRASTPGTCEWLKKVSQYSTWITPEDQNRFLWIHGTAGKGKTFLSIYLANELRLQNKLTLQYFCDNRDSRRNTASAVLMGFVYQLLDEIDNLKLVEGNHSHIVQGHLSAIAKGNEAPHEALWYAFEELIGSIPKDVYIVLDGLDECDEGSIDFLKKKFEAMYSNNFEGNRKPCTLIVSRNLGIKSSSRIDLDDHAQETKRDLLCYIYEYVERFSARTEKNKERNKLDMNQLYEDYRSGKMKDFSSRGKLCSTLLDRANNTYLWVALAMDVLDNDAVERILKSEDAVDKFLPEGLNAIVNRMLLEALEGEDEPRRRTNQKDIAKITRWVSLAFRPLTAAEIRAVTGVTDNSIRKCKHILSLPKNVIEGQKIDDETKMQLVHQSLKGYLLQPSLMFRSLSSMGLLLRPYLLYPVGYLVRLASDVPFLEHSLTGVILLVAWSHLPYALTIPAIAVYGSTLGTIGLKKFHPVRSFLEKLHQSLKLCIFSVHEKEAHKDLFVRCLDLMKHRLPTDPDLESAGENRRCEDLDYACQHWAQHLQQGEGYLNVRIVPTFSRQRQLCRLGGLGLMGGMFCFQHLQRSRLLDDRGLVHQFFLDHLLHWIEALGRMKMTSEGVATLQILKPMASKSPLLYAFIKDASRFFTYSQSIIEQEPLQTYSSALVFAPHQSLVRKEFERQIPLQFEILPKVREQWGSLIRTFEGYNEKVTLLTFSPDDTLVALASDNRTRTVTLWEPATGRCNLMPGGHDQEVTSVALSPDGKSVVSAFYDGTVNLWDLATGRCTPMPKGHSQRVTSVAFSPDSTRIMSASYYGTVMSWEVTTDHCREIFECERGREHYQLAAFSPDCNFIALISGYMPNIWEMSKPQDGPIRESDIIFLDSTYNIYSVAFSPNSDFVAVASYNGAVRLWKLATGQRTPMPEGHSQLVTSVAFSPDSTLIASASSDMTIKLSGVTTGHCHYTFDSYSTFITSVVFSPNSESIAAASWGQGIKIWEVPKPGDIVPNQYGHSQCVTSVVFSPDGTLVASLSKDEYIILWKIAKDQYSQMRKFRPCDPCISAIFSPDSTLIASISKSHVVELWDVATIAVCELPVIQIHSTTSVIFSPDGKYVALGFNTGTVTLCELLKDKDKSKVEAEFYQLYDEKEHVISSVAFSPDNKSIAAAHEDGTIKIRDVPPDKDGIGQPKLAPLSDWYYISEGHNKRVTFVVFSPNNKLIASASEDKTVKLWDVARKSCLQTFDVGSILYHLSFDSTSASLHTARGILLLIPQFANTMSLEQSDYTGYGVSTDGIWITWNSKKLLWLPQEYRPYSSAVAGSIVALGCMSGQFLIFRFSADRPYA